MTKYLRTGETVGSLFKESEKRVFYVSIVLSLALTLIGILLWRVQPLGFKLSYNIGSGLLLASWGISIGCSFHLIVSFNRHLSDGEDENI